MKLGWNYIPTSNDSTKYGSKAFGGPVVEAAKCLKSILTFWKSINQRPALVLLPVFVPVEVAIHHSRI